MARKTVSKVEDYPRIAALMDAGHIRIESDGSLTGIAADGVEVSLWNTNKLNILDTYLRDFPTPESW